MSKLKSLFGFAGNHLSFVTFDHHTESTWVFLGLFILGFLKKYYFWGVKVFPFNPISGFFCFFFQRSILFS